jgi:competence protein ComEC
VANGSGHDPPAPGAVVGLAESSTERRRDPDPDGVTLVAAVAVGVLAGVRVGPTAWPLAGMTTLATALAVLLLGSGGRPGRGPRRGRRPALVGALGLATLTATGAAVTGVRAAAVQDALLPRLAGRGATVALQGTVAEEPSVVRYGGLWVVISVRRVELGGRTWRTRERAGVVLSRSTAPLAAGDGLRLRAAVERSDRAGPLGGEPPVVLRRPHVESRQPARSLPLRASEAVRAAARRRVVAELPPERAGLLVGMALGDTSLLVPDLDRAFKAAGLTHLLAVSGQNVAVVLAAGLGVAVALGARRPALATIGIVLVALFALLTRWEPSVLRAGVMAVLTLLGVATGRGPGGRRALCLAVLLLLLANPALVTSLGFQLSIAATAGVLWLGPLAAELLPARLPQTIRTGVGISLGAQAGALPVLALALGQVSIAGLAANLVAVPLAALPMLLGVVAAASAAVAPPLASLACRVADPFLGLLVALAGRAATLPGASPALAGPARLVPALVVVALVAAAHHRRAAARRPAAPDRATEDRRRVRRRE